ncbi:MAG: PorT family protein, partial [Fibrobacter sp.]|nr:PorT family protein [Fibrobacter sp.]
NSYFSVRNDIGIAYRQGTGNANTSFIMSWEDGNRAAEKSDLQIEYTIKQLNIDIPLLARVSIPSALYFEVGPMFSFNVYSKNKSVITDIYGSETYESDGELNAFEFDIATGIGISRNLEKSILDIDLRFVIGLTRISDSKDSPKTWQGQLNITYWFL